MSATANWLEKLQTATDYKALQEVYAEMAAAAHSPADPAALARSIDEALRRLVEERSRDEAELRQTQSQYDSFQQDNRGVVGWFKRHIPFTETRRQELQHREEVADQAAEILADNLVIARAQMLKERFLPPAERRLGLKPAEWQGRLESSNAASSLPSLAAALKELAGEAERSRAFCDELKRDIEAFGGAAFKSAEDRQRRDADLAGARQELAALEREVADEAGLKRTGFERLGQRVAGDLTSGDAAFRDAGQQIERLQAVLQRLDGSRTACSRLTASANEVGRHVKELQALPGEIQQLRDAQLRAERQRDDAAAACARKTALLQERLRVAEDARRALEQKVQAQKSTKAAYDAYQAERLAAQSTGIPTAPPADSPLMRQMQEAQAAVDAAQVACRTASQPYEAAKAEADQAQAAQAAAAKQCDDIRAKISALEAKGPGIRQQIATAADAGHRSFADAANALAAVLAAARDGNPALSFRPDELAAGTFGWLGPQGFEQRLAGALLQAEQGYQQHVQAIALLDRVSKWQDAQRNTLESQRAELSARREAAWKGKLRELLGDTLAQEAFAATKL